MLFFDLDLDLDLDTFYSVFSALGPSGSTSAPMPSVLPSFSSFAGVSTTVSSALTETLSFSAASCAFHSA
jgi:hypothetical protein